MCTILFLCLSFIDPKTYLHESKVCTNYCVHLVLTTTRKSYYDAKPVTNPK